MRLYLAYPRTFALATELENFLKNSNFGVEIIFPHEKHKQMMTPKDLLRDSDMMVAEVSDPALGVGIEMGFASAFDVPVYCFFRKGVVPSPSLPLVADEVMMYANKEELFHRLRLIITEKRGF